MKRWSFEVLCIGKVVAESKGQFLNKKQAEDAGYGKARALKKDNPTVHYTVRVRKEQ